jgi:hypothetical protein
LRICGDILHNYLSGYEKVPYQDLQYLLKESVQKECRDIKVYQNLEDLVGKIFNI